MTLGLFTLNFSQEDMNSKFSVHLANNTIFEITPQEGIGNTTFDIRVANSSYLDYEKVKSITIKVSNYYAFI